MSNTDGKTAAPGGNRAPGRPTLMGGPAPAAPGATDTQGIRMLAELDGKRDDDSSGMTRRTTTAFIALGLALAGVLVWWMNRPTAGEAERIAAAELAAPAPRPVTEAASAAELVTVRTAASAPDAATAEAPAASAAGIEAAPQPPTAAPAAAVAAAPAASPVRVAKAAPRSTPAPKPRAVAARDPDPLGTFIAQQPRATTQATTTSLAAPAAAVRREKTAQDADVELIAALLARVSNEHGAAGPIAQNDQLTIAQIIRRCEARPEAEVLACKRRICDGYWGKADACPKRLAPASKGAAG